MVVHYRIRGNDSVSLKIEKRKEIFKLLELKPIFVAGPISSGIDYLIDELEFDLPQINLIKRNSFFELKEFKSCRELLEKIYEISGKIYNKIVEIYKKENLNFSISLQLKHFMIL